MMTTSHVLYIASNSASRKKLLEVAKIPFKVIEQDADESLVSIHQPLSEIVMQIALLKMEHAHIPVGQVEGEICFVLTADTLGLTTGGRVLCKPTDRSDAISMLVDSRAGTVTATGFCLRKMQWQNNSWVVLQEVIDFDQANSIFDVSDDCMDFYLDAIPFLSVSGAISIEGFGGQFLKSVDGSYETIIGLPMFKIRHALWSFGFYE
ncbi:MAG: Maf family protein [Candidatus Chromulinivorax sp.]|nr:Maf family protein [Candidatus Chromulinivorax sp.]